MNRIPALCILLQSAFVIVNAKPGHTRNLIQLPTPDYSCTDDDDCTAKNVGNCCGYYPKCVNVDYVPDHEAMRAWCKETGTYSVCGWPVIDYCECDAGNCRG
eukprot:636296_1